MPRPSHRIDVLAVPADPERSVGQDDFETLKARWAAGEPDDLVAGGFRRVWLDLPGRMVLYANQQGGFRVRCPKGGDEIARAFEAAHRAWRRGGERILPCPGCGQAHPFDVLEFAPPAAFGRCAVVFADAASISLSDHALSDLQALLGEVKVVVRRV